MIESAAILSINPPVTGDWVAINTPAERVPSHGTHFLGQTYAYDLARTSRSGTSFSHHSLWRQFFLRVPAQAFFAWGEPVFAAFPGAVVAAEDDWPDRKQINALWEVLRAHVLQRKPKKDDLRPLLGNYVLTKGEDGVALYAHLQRGSLTVRPGDHLIPGQQIASVGNSGNSTMPHLHFQVTDTANLWEAKGIPCGFLGASHTPNIGAEMPLVPSLMKPFHAVSPHVDI